LALSVAPASVATAATITAATVAAATIAAATIAAATVAAATVAAKVRQLEVLVIQHDGQQPVPQWSCCQFTRRGFPVSSLAKGLPE
jgi:hypothetical protein